MPLTAAPFKGLSVLNTNQVQGQFVNKLNRRSLKNVVYFSPNIFRCANGCVKIFVLLTILKYP